MTVDLIIAGRRIRLRSEDGVALLPDERFRAFIAASDGEPDLSVDVWPGRDVIPADSRKVFDAKLMEETPEGVKSSGELFWEVFDGGGITRVRVFLKEPARTPVLVMPHGKMTWQIFADADARGEGQNMRISEGRLQAFADSGGKANYSLTDGDGVKTVNPLPYPVDGLLLWFLSSATGDIMIHGSGVVCGGRGWIFTGRSGSGKTTIAGIFDRAGDRVIHDDRLILRREAAGWVMHSTPVYRNDEPRSAGVDHLWAISHGTSNISMPVAGAGAVAMVMSNCIQQNRDREAASRLAASVEELVSEVKISRLTFLPDSSIRDYLDARESAGYGTSAGAAAAILSEEMGVTITAGGYSMWPAIKPGERIVIMPYDPQVPLEKGMAVALRRDGGFVVHRVTDFKSGKVPDYHGGEVADHQGNKVGDSRSGEVADDRESKFTDSRKAEVRDFIRTRGDTAMAYDPWVPADEVAGLVKRLTEAGEMKNITRRRMPYFMGSIAVALIKIFIGIRRRF